MVVSGPLGFNPFSAIATGAKAVGKGVARVAVRTASDPNVQRAAISAGTAYAQTKYAPQYARAAGLYAQGKSILRPPGAPMGPPGAAPPEAADEDGGGGGGGAPAPAQRGNLMLIGGLVAAGILVFVLTR